MKCYWKTFLFGGFLKLIGDITGLIPPLGISVVVNYIEAIQIGNKDNDNTSNEVKYYILFID